MVVFRGRRSWLSTITPRTANEQMFRFKENLLEILFLAGSAGHNEMGPTLGLKDYSLSSTGIFDTKTRESKQDVVWNARLPYFWEGFPGQEKGQHGRCSTGCYTQPLSGTFWMTKSSQNYLPDIWNVRWRAGALQLFSHNTASGKRRDISNEIKVYDCPKCNSCRIIKE